MNPNSRNQVWSKWEWTIRPGRRLALPFEPVKLAIANFAGRHFGKASQMRITEKLDHYRIELLTEGKPVHDPDFVTWTAGVFENFFTVQFGVGTVTQLAPPKLMAGSRQDGSPHDQLIILPTLNLRELAKG